MQLRAELIKTQNDLILFFDSQCLKIEFNPEEMDIWIGLKNKISYYEKALLSYYENELKNI
jgi:hypothetical protein